MLMFANKMLITSLFSSLLLSIWMVILSELFLCTKRPESSMSSPVTRIAITLGRVLAMGMFMLLFKTIVITRIQEDDSHIWDILKSKFNDDFKTFDTRLYTCAKEFDFIEMETFVKLSSTGLLIVSFVTFIFNSILAIRELFY